MSNDGRAIDTYTVKVSDAAAPQPVPKPINKKKKLRGTQFP